MSEQLNAGTIKGTAFCHTDSDGLWWSGWSIHKATPEQLFAIADSLRRDLLGHYPRLAKDEITRLQAQVAALTQLYLDERAGCTGVAEDAWDKIKAAKGEAT